MGREKDSDKRLLDILDLTVEYDEEQLAAVEHQIPMTAEIYRRCLVTCIQVRAEHELWRLMGEYPELLKEVGDSLFDEIEEGR